jgi:translocation and assembly module TamA
MIPKAYPAALRLTTGLGALAAFGAWLLLVPVRAQESDARTESPSQAPAPAPAGEDPPPDPPGLPYTAEVTAGEDEDLATLGQAVAQTVALRERAPTDAFGLIGRVRADLPRLQEALRAEGYWGGQVTATIAGLAPDDPALPVRLQPRPRPCPW